MDGESESYPEGYNYGRDGSTWKKVYSKKNFLTLAKNRFAGGYSRVRSLYGEQNHEH